ncbi:hypothetical protein [Denitrobaculum tricleocarpae]|uniref:Uncharacterized protein n=1 Tax=Denitrobaculum tricleocarpae TaxID=2591009 RepID=A0A545TFU1_9PROT|nr:hypothetical protein [Denitrobaculum tricleocarpae]TQV76092.1 hypothetical protein FKG95_20815 [Denitrobaculum tricleocarpae]
MPGFIAQLRPVTTGNGADRRKAFGFPAAVGPVPAMVGSLECSPTVQSPWGAPMRPISSGWSLPLIPGDLAVASGLKEISFEEMPPAPAQQSAA